MPRQPFDFESNDEDLLDPILGQRPSQPIYPTPSGNPIPQVSKVSNKLIPDRMNNQSEPTLQEAVPEAKPATISEPVLAKLAETQPDLVARYREKMSASDKGVKDAQDTQDMATYGNVFGKIANDFGNSQKDDTIYRNSWSKMGNAPQVDKAERKEYDGSAVSAIGTQAVGRAKDAKAASEQEFMTGEKLSEMQTARDDQQVTRERLLKERDPASSESQAAREYLKKVAPTATSMPNFDNLSATQIEKIAPSLYQAYNASEQRKTASADRQESREMRLALSGQAKDAKAQEKVEKNAEKLEQLRVGDLGYANNADDAKKLKDASVIKDKLNRQLDDMIALRKKHGGGALLNREDVALGKQLATDAKLAYKDLANLGVLSASDKGMLDDILPDDPLEYNVSGLAGQDPTMAKIKNFQANKNKEFNDSINTRLRKEGRGPSTQAAGNTSKGVVHGSNLPD